MLGGSGTWTRLDSSATRCRPLWKTGPAQHEVYRRDTFDAESGALLDTLMDYASAKSFDKELPPPVPRSLRTVFHFRRTAANIPADATFTEATPTVGA